MSELEIVQELKHVQVMNLEPGDILVIRCESRISAEAAARLRDTARKAFPGHECMVISECDLAVARSSQVEPPPPGPDRLVERGWPSRGTP